MAHADIVALRDALARVTNALEIAVQWMPEDAEWKEGSDEQWVMQSVSTGRNALALVSDSGKDGR